MKYFMRGNQNAAGGFNKMRREDLSKCGGRNFCMRREVFRKRREDFCMRREALNVMRCDEFRQWHRDTWFDTAKRKIEKIDNFKYVRVYACVYACMHVCM